MLKKYLLDDTSYYNINFMLNDYCNNRCTYCRQFGDYGNKEVSVKSFFSYLDFFRAHILPQHRTFLLEGGEPSFFTHLGEIFQGLQDRGEKIVLLTNGRVPDKNKPLILSGLQRGVIESIGLHVPFADEPYKIQWEKDIDDFLEYLAPFIENKIIVIGLMHTVNVEEKEFIRLLKYRKNYPHLIEGNSFCFPHPNIMARHYIDYKSRLQVMEKLIKVFLYMMQNNYPIILDSTLPCILQHGLEKYNLQGTKFSNYLMNSRVSMIKNFEFHIGIEGEITCLSNIAKTCFIQTGKIGDYDSFQALQKNLNTIITQEYGKYFSEMPEKCRNCRQFLKGCTGNHFKLISQFTNNTFVH